MAICPFAARFEFPAGSRYEWLAGNYLIARAGRLTVLALLTERAVVKKIPEHLGPPATGPPKAPARWAAQLDDDRPADELRDELPNYDS